jgi:LacI family transcriptional regulator
MRARITQGDIARRAGVHRTTVSLALRNHPSIPLQTRQRIQSLAESMQYRPDPNLCALMVYRNAVRGKKITSTIGYLTNWTSRWGWKSAPAHDEFHAGAVAKAKELGFGVEHFWLGEPALSPHRLSDILLARGIRGVLIASQAERFDDLDTFAWAEFSAVKIDFLPNALRLDYVTNDQRSILQTAMRRILGAGYRRIGLVMPQSWDEAMDLAWSAGFLAIQARLPEGDRVPPLLYATDPAAAEVGRMGVPTAPLAAWVREYRPEVILGFSGFVLPALTSLGLRVPEDIAFADVLLQDDSGRLAGMRQNCRRVGEIAMETLAHHLAHNLTGLPEVPVAAMVEGTWCDGTSLPVAAACCHS